MSRSASRLTGQNVRGLTSLKLAKVCQFMKDRDIQVACLAETWRVTPNGVEFEVTEDGCLVFHHGETEKSCARGKKGVAIILSPKVRKTWELGRSRFCSGNSGRTLSIKVPLAGQRTWVVGCGYAPISSESSAIRQAFYDEVSSSIGCANSQTVVNFFLDANASPGVGVKS